MPGSSREQPLFSASPFAYVRTPLLRYDDAWQFFTGDWRERLRTFLQANHAVCVAIHVASPSLSHALRAWLEQGCISERAARSILAYVLRASTRTSPFGLFAAVSRVEAGDFTTARIDSQPHTRTRPDMEWLAAAVELWKRDWEFRQWLYVSVNDALLVRGDRYTAFHPALVRSAAANRRMTYLSASFRQTQAVLFLKERLTEPMRLADLAALLQQRFGQEPQACVQLLDQLWEAGFFVDELQLDPTGDPVRAVARVLARAEPGRAAAFEELISQLAALDETPLQQRTLERYRSVEDVQRAVSTASQRTLQTDAVRALEGTLARCVFDDAAELARVMLHWYPLELKRYRERFVEKFESLGREVGLLELVHPSLGLGAPEDPELGYGLSPERIERRIALACEALADGRMEVELDRRELEALLAPRDDARAGSSFDLGFEVYASSRESVDRGEYLMAASALVYAPVAGAAVGRFAGALGERTQQDLAGFSRAIQAVHPDAALAELVVMPSHSRGLNVAIRPAHLPYRVEVGLMQDGKREHVLTPDDLVVGLDGRGFYVRSRRLNKRVEIMQTHVFDTAAFTPPISRFLALLAYDGVIFPHTFDWGPAYRMTFLPRLRCGRLIVSKARWRFEKRVLSALRPAERETFMQRWRLPRYVRVAARDGMLPIDLSSAIGWELLQERADADGDAITCEELLPAPGQAWLEDERSAPYHAEFIASFVRTQPLVRPLDAFEPVARSARERAPGSEWTYLKLYTDADDMDRFLTSAVVPLASALRAACAMERWFFVRYADPEPHLRLRIQSPAEEAAAAIRIVNERLQSWVETGVLARAEYATYEREVERYGGLEGMEACERIFAADSAHVLAQCVTHAPGSSERLAACARSAALIALAASGFDPARACEAIRYAREARMNDADRAAAKRLAQDLRGGELSAGGELTAEIEHLLEIGHAGRLRRPLGDIADSLIHMHCNRSGLTAELETRARVIARQALHSARRQPSPQNAPE